MMSTILSTILKVNLPLGKRMQLLVLRHKQVRNREGLKDSLITIIFWLANTFLLRLLMKYVSGLRSIAQTF